MIKIKKEGSTASFVEVSGKTCREVPAKEALKIIRKETGWSVGEMAEHLGVAVGTINNWDQGRRKIPQTAILLLSCLLERRQLKLFKERALE